MVVRKTLSSICDIGYYDLEKETPKTDVSLNRISEFVVFLMKVYFTVAQISCANAGNEIKNLFTEINSRGIVALERT